MRLGRVLRDRSRIIPKIGRWLINALYKTRWQLTLAVGLGVILTVTPVFTTGDSEYTNFEHRADYIGFMLGMASILALVASINFGFLLHHMQSIVNERYLLYGRFKDNVRELRDFLDDLHDDGVIDETYDFHFGLIDDLRLDNFPVLDWDELIGPLTDWVEEQEDVISNVDFGRLIRGYVYRGSDIEELVTALLFNWLKHIGTSRMLTPVLKAFSTLAVVILAILVTVVTYEGVITTVLWGVALALTVMSLLLIVEIGLSAWREGRELAQTGIPDPAEEEDAEAGPSDPALEVEAGAGLPDSPVDEETVWHRIRRHAGEEFRTKSRLPFTYEVYSSYLRTSRTDYNLSRGDFEKALTMMPAKGPGLLTATRRGSAYIWGILMDDRIRSGDW